ncbi:MAG: tRNA-specific adenosine deaminase [Candidatus Angelobacter sp. Gp1-AA117]|nr:MAG: tRNA-specific adenosine deaminase [Candidatus Angelobacter sp. Gp1-AA117]
MNDIVKPPAGGNAVFMRRVIELSRESMNTLHGGPFGALVIKGEKIISEGTNSVTLWNDPTAHAEVVAIRRACTALNTFQLTDCDIYTSCEPCPMCLGAIYWARPRVVYYAGERTDAAQAGFDDDLIYRELPLPPSRRSIPMVQMMHEEATRVLAEWNAKPDKIRY